MDLILCFLFMASTAVGLSKTQTWHQKYPVTGTAGGLAPGVLYSVRPREKESQITFNNDPFSSNLSPERETPPTRVPYTPPRRPERPTERPERPNERPERPEKPVAHHDSKIPHSDSRIEFLHDSNFDTRILHEVFTTKKGENIIISPVSVKLTLALLLEGASSRTASELRATLGLHGKMSQVREPLAQFQRSLQRENANVNVNSANFFFVSQNLQINPDYHSKVSLKYHANIVPVNFRDSDQVSHLVNSWVKEKTHGVVDNLVSAADISSELKLLLVNTMYFKGKWDLGFSNKTTVMRCFTPFNGECHNVPMMETNAMFNFTQVSALNAQALELPYKDERYSLVLMIPHSHEQEAFNTLVRDLPRHQIRDIMSTMRPKKVFVSLPRFTFSSTTQLVPTLQNLGLRELFSSDSNLSGILERGEKLSVDKMVQKAKIELDEHGTVSAAATGTFIIPLSSSIGVFEADRPFIFLLRDRETGAILFEGIVSDPDTFTSNQL